MPAPQGAETVWRAFGEMDAQRHYTDSGIPQAIRHADVEAWCRTMRTPLHPAEVVAVLTLDAARRAFDIERRKGASADEDDDE